MKKASPYGVYDSVCFTSGRFFCVCVSVVLVGQVTATCVERTQILMRFLTVISGAETTTVIRYRFLHPHLLPH